MLRPELAEQIEATLLERMEECYRDKNDVAEEVANYFERQSEKEEWSFGEEWQRYILASEKERKQRTLASERAPTGAQGASERPADSGPPPANRGVTFHDTNFWAENSEPSGRESFHGIMGGYDGGVELGFDGKWMEVDFATIKKMLSVAKMAAEDESSDDRFVELGGKRFEVSAKGAREGTFYEWSLLGDGMRILIFGKSECKNVQLIRIRYMSEGVIGRDFFLKHAETLEFLHEIGFMVQEEKFSRLDMQAMFFMDVSEFMKRIFNNQGVCTAQKETIHRRGKFVQTYTLGTDLQICIYDKRAELLANMRKSPEKLALMTKYCFGEDWLEQEIPVTRVEFRLRRKMLKALKINTVDDLLTHENGLAHYCTHSWFRLLSEPKKKGHTHEQRTDPLWETVQNEFARWFPGADGHREECYRHEKDEFSCNIDGDVAQARGCLAKAVAYATALDDAVVTVENAIEMVAEMLRRDAGKFLDSIIDRKNEIIVRNNLAAALHRKPEYSEFGPVICDVSELPPYVAPQKTCPERQHVFDDEIVRYNVGVACDEF